MTNDCAIFLDTNIYLHFNWVAEIAWQELAGKPSVILIVPPIVLSELEKHRRTHRSKQIRERARLVIQRLNQLFNSDKFVRQGVNINFLSSEPKEFEKHDLDRSWADDRLLASILHYNEQHTDMPTFLVTDDFPIVPKATVRGIALLKMPEEYRLPIQPDPEEAKIKELQKRLNELQSLSPRLTLQFENGLNYCSFQRPPVAPAEPSWEDFERIKEKYPHLWQAPLEVGLINAFHQLSVGRFSEYEIEQYNGKLDQFYLRSQEYLEGSYKIDELKSRSLTLDVEVANAGNLPAEDIRVLVKFPTSLDLCDLDRFSYPKKPTPPRKPQPGERLNISDLVARPYPSPFNAADLSRALERQRVRWLGLSQENDFKVATFEVQKLNHPYSERCPHPIIVVFDNRDAMNSFTIEFEISAANVPGKKTGQLHVIVTDTDT